MKLVIETGLYCAAIWCALFLLTLPHGRAAEWAVIVFCSSSAILWTIEMFRKPTQHIE